MIAQWCNGIFSIFFFLLQHGGCCVTIVTVLMYNGRYHLNLTPSIIKRLLLI